MMGQAIDASSQSRFPFEGKESNKPVKTSLNLCPKVVFFTLAQIHWTRSITGPRLISKGRVKAMLSCAPKEESRVLNKHSANHH